jgi:hypothetical protein
LVRRSGRLWNALGAVQILLPLGVDTIDRDHDPNALMRGLGRVLETKAHLRHAAVLFAGVTGAAGSDDVVPGVRAPATTRDHMVDILGRSAAILAAVVVSHENRPPREGRSGPKGHLHEVIEADDTGRGDGQGLRVENLPVRMHDLGFAIEGEHQCPPDWNDAQRLVRGVEYKRSAQGAPKYSEDVVLSSGGSHRFLTRARPARWQT